MWNDIDSSFVQQAQVVAPAIIIQYSLIPELYNTLESFIESYNLKHVKDINSPSNHTNNNEMENKENISLLSGFSNKKQLMAIACRLYILLSNVNIMLVEDNNTEAIKLHEAIGCSMLKLSKISLTVLHSPDKIKQKISIDNCETQLVDCRESDAFSGFKPDSDIVGKLTNSINIPFSSLYHDDNDTLLSDTELIDMIKHTTDLDSTKGILVYSTVVNEAAVVAIRLKLIGYEQLTLCNIPLSLSLANTLPREITKAIYSQKEVILADSKFVYDTSPENSMQSESSLDNKDSKDLKSLYDELLQETKAKPQSRPFRFHNGNVHENENLISSSNIVWKNDGGDTFFDMPICLSRDDFLAASLDIYHLVTFVVAPFGFSNKLKENLSISELKLKIGSLLQDVIEVCSDTIYDLRQLTEGAMAMSVHKYLEEVKDAECSKVVANLNNTLEHIYDPPVFIEVPLNLDEKKVVRYGTELIKQLFDHITERAHWATDTNQEFDSDTTESQKLEKNSFKCQSALLQRSMYISVFRTLGFSPKIIGVKCSIDPVKRSALQLKAFIQASVEAVKDTFMEKNSLSFSQVQYQALFDAIENKALRSEFEHLKNKYLSEDSPINVLTHYLIKPKSASKVCSSSENNNEEEIQANLSCKKVLRKSIKQGEQFLAASRYRDALAAFGEALELDFPEYTSIYPSELEPVMLGRAKSLLRIASASSSEGTQLIQNVKGSDNVLKSDITYHPLLHHTKTLISIVLKHINPYSGPAYILLGELENSVGNIFDSMQHYVTAFVLDGSRSPKLAEEIDRVARVVGQKAAKPIFDGITQKHKMPSSWLVDSYFDAFEYHDDDLISISTNISKQCDEDMMSNSANNTDYINPFSNRDLLHRAIYFKRKKAYVAAQTHLFMLTNRPQISRLSQEQPESAPNDCDSTLTNKELGVVWNLHASFLYVVGDVVNAIDAITQSISYFPESVNSLIKKGGFLSEFGEVELANQCFDDALALDINSPDIYVHMGQKEIVEGNFREAVSHLRKAITRSESLTVTYVSYGMALYKSGSVYQANDVFKDALEKFPSSHEVHLFYGDILADQGNFADAMKHFYIARNLSPHCPLSFLNAGRVFVSTNDPARAISHFRQALVVDQKCSSAHLDIAQVLFAQGRTGEAFKHFDTAAQCCRFLPEVEEVCSCEEMAKMQLKVTTLLGVELRHLMKRH